MSDWGQGINNTIGWGQGFINNTINWGKSYVTSWTGETDITGVVYKITTDFKARVLLDSGTFESESCLVTKLTNLNI